MQTNSLRAAFESMGEAQVMAAQGQQELARLIVRAIAHGLQSVLGRFRRPRAGRSFV